MLAPVKCYTTNGVRFSKTRTTIVLSSVPNLSANQKRRETLLSLLLIFGQEERRRREARVSLFCLTKYCSRGSPLCAVFPSLKTLFCHPKPAAKTRVKHYPYGRPHPHKIGYYLPILWEDNSVIIPSLLSLPFPIN